jgi:transcriptional regulator with XRE-family HTH domain
MLSRDFGNGDEPWRALETMGNLHQRKDSASDYFLKLKQLASMAGVDVQNSSHMIIQIERNMNPVLIDQLYQSANAPQNYSEDLSLWMKCVEEERCSEGICQQAFRGTL